VLGDSLRREMRRRWEGYRVATVDFGRFEARGKVGTWEMVASLVTNFQYLIILLIRSFERRARIRMGVAEVEGIEGVGWGVMSLIGLWKAVKKLKRALCGGQLRTIAARPCGIGTGLLPDGQFVSP
jgi:hypothetical protein